MKRTHNQKYSSILIQIQWRKQKLYRQTKSKRIQHHQSNFASNAKGTFLGGKEKAARKKENYEEKNSPVKANMYVKGG